MHTFDEVLFNFRLLVMNTTELWIIIMNAYVYFRKMEKNEKENNHSLEDSSQPDLVTGNQFSNIH